MPLTKQQLLIPRVLCIGGKEGEPNDTSGNFISGEILIQKFKDKPEKWYNERLQFSVRLKPEWVLKFSHLFNPLPWWYGRTVEELPEYLNIDGGVFKVDMYDFGNDVAYVFIITVVPVLLRQCTPADESEYQEYQKQREA
jgi:hypothetical protein